MDALIAIVALAIIFANNIIWMKFYISKKINESNPNFKIPEIKILGTNKKNTSSETGDSGVPSFLVDAMSVPPADMAKDMRGKMQENLKNR